MKPTGGRGKTATDKYVILSITLHPDVLHKLDLYKISTGQPRSAVLQDLVLRCLPDAERVILDSPPGRRLP